MVAPAGETPGGVPAHAQARTAGRYDRTRAYRLHPKVALRPERFGALAYSYATRRLSLLKDRDLVTCVEGLAAHSSAAAAIDALDVPPEKKPVVERALARLVETGFLVARDIVRDLTTRGSGGNVGSARVAGRGAPRAAG